MKTVDKQCENCGNPIRTCGKCGWSKVYEEDLSHLREANKQLELTVAQYAAKLHTAENDRRILDEECERIGRDKARIANEKADIVAKNKQLEAERDTERKWRELLQADYHSLSARTAQAEKERDIAVKALEEIVTGNYGGPLSINTAKTTLDEIRRIRDGRHTESD